MRGFSLVELSIVLVILGLLTGGILAGQSLIRASELRAVTAEYQRYAAAVNTFRDKYFAIPGDMREATRFWGHLTGTGCTNNTSAAANTTTGTCDGTGDGWLASPGAASQSGELFQLWRQLALAGLIEGSYTGIATATAANDAVIGTNVPQSKLGNAGWSAQAAVNYGGDGQAYAVDYGNMFVFGGKTNNSLTYNAVLKPEEAWNIDTKMDDGKPAQGKVIARYWSNACAAADDGSHANNDLVASYKLGDSTIQCSLHFRQQF